MNKRALYGPRPQSQFGLLEFNLMNALSTQKRTVFFISDRTGITAEALGQSLLTQFDSFEFKQVLAPFVNTEAEALEIRQRIDRCADADGVRPIVFSTVVLDAVRVVLREGNCLFLDFFDTFIGPLEAELDTASSHISGKAHGETGSSSYQSRIDAMNYALENDDGMTTRKYDRADVILTGVSRSGKTPTCLYLALHYGVYAANYPLTEEDLESTELPAILREHRGKLFGLSILPERLQEIRSERRPDSRYASARQCQEEVRAAERLFADEQIPFVNTTSTSIEEIATRVFHERQLKRRFF